jgi:hypothetical protein
MCIITDLISPEMRLGKRASVFSLHLNSEVRMTLCEQTRRLYGTWISG